MGRVLQKGSSYECFNNKPPSYYVYIKENLKLKNKKKNEKKQRS